MRQSSHQEDLRGSRPRVPPARLLRDLSRLSRTAIRTGPVSISCRILLAFLGCTGYLYPIRTSIRTGPVSVSCRILLAILDCTGYLYPIRYPSASAISSGLLGIRYSPRRSHLASDRNCSARFWPAPLLTLRRRPSGWRWQVGLATAVVLFLCALGLRRLPVPRKGVQAVGVAAAQHGTQATTRRRQMWLRRRGRRCWRAGAWLRRHRLLDSSSAAGLRPCSAIRARRSACALARPPVPAAGEGGAGRRGLRARCQRGGASRPAGAGREEGGRERERGGIGYERGVEK